MTKLYLFDDSGAAMTDTVSSPASTRLITARTLRKLTQSKTAKRAGISASYLAELEKTGDTPSPDVRKRLARVLRFGERELFTIPED